MLELTHQDIKKLLLLFLGAVMQRLSREGKTFAQIAQKTGFPEAEVRKLLG
jgi:DNA-directed RNA polymerase specialized sigma24 family protein